MDTYTTDQLREFEELAAAVKAAHVIGEQSPFLSPYQHVYAQAEADILRGMCADLRNVNALAELLDAYKATEDGGALLDLTERLEDVGAAEYARTEAAEALRAAADRMNAAQCQHHESLSKRAVTLASRMDTREPFLMENTAAGEFLVPRRTFEEQRALVERWGMAASGGDTER